MSRLVAEEQVDPKNVARLLAEENGTLVLKLKHFNPDFSAWEEKAAFTSFKLVAVEERAVHFDGLSFIREPLEPRDRGQGGRR